MNGSEICSITYIILLTAAQVLKTSLQKNLEVDAFGRIPSAVLSMKRYFMGSWDECIGLQTDQNPDYKAKFCYIFVGMEVSVNSGFFSGIKVT